MLELILFPFQLAWDLLCAAFSIVFGLVELVFGLIGGLIELCVSIAVIVLIVALIRAALANRRDRNAQDEEFTSFYSGDGKVE